MSRAGLREYLRFCRGNSTPPIAQSDLDILIDKPEGFTAQVEAGDIIPDAATCCMMDAALGVDSGNMWAALNAATIPPPPPPLHEWEVANGSAEGTWRMLVPGGWLYRYSWASAAPMVFVPDIDSWCNRAKPNQEK